jgi:hypothetical protein
MADGLVLRCDGGSSTTLPRALRVARIGIERAATDFGPLQSVTDAGVEFETTFDLPEWAPTTGRNPRAA